MASAFVDVTEHLSLRQNHEVRETASCYWLSGYRGCKRAFAWENLYGLRSKPKPWHKKGKRVHRILENYVKRDLNAFMDDGTPESIEAVKIALSTTRLLPPLDQLQYVETEAPITFDPTWAGARDFTACASDEWYNIDYKTTKDFRYQKKPEDLAKDLQAIVYSYDVMLRYGPPYVANRWIYTLTSKKSFESRPTDIVLYRGYVEDEKGKIDEQVIEARQLVRAHRTTPIDPNQLPPSPESCESYGGCPYAKSKLGPCNYSQRLGDRIKMNSAPGAMPSFQDMLAARNAPQQPQQQQQPGQGPANGLPPGFSPQPPMGQAPAPQFAPQFAPPQPQQQQQQQFAQPQQQFAPPQPQQPPQFAPPQPQQPPQFAPPQPAPNPILPPEAYQQQPATPQPGQPPTFVQQPQQQVLPPAAPAAAAPARRGRPRKNPVQTAAGEWSPPGTLDSEEEAKEVFVAEVIKALSGTEYFAQCLASGMDPATLAATAARYAAAAWQMAQMTCAPANQ